MADTKISALANIPTLDGGDVLPIVDATDITTKNVSVTQLDGRYVVEADIAAKGDLFVGTANDTVGVLSVGANDQVLTADSATGTGVKWAALPAGYTDEQVRDVMGAALVAGANVTITVNDGADTITVAASGGGGGVSQGLVSAVDGGVTRSGMGF